MENILGKWKEVRGICMASSTEIDGYFTNKPDAIDRLAAYAVEDDLIISGWGKHSGTKFWQLPEYLQKQVKKAAGGGLLTDH